MDVAGVDVEIDVIKEYPELEDLEINPSKEEQTFNSSKYGFRNIKINAIKGETLDLNPSTEQQNIEGVFTRVNLNPIKTQKLNTVPSTQEQVIIGLFDEVTVNAIEGEELNLNPSEEQQNFEGVFLGVNINPIQVEEIITDLDFSSSDAIELTAQEGAYIKKATINKDVNLTPENIKTGISISGISGDVADTSDADATSNDIAAGKSAYVQNEKVIGTASIFDSSQLRSCYEMFWQNQELIIAPELDTSNVLSAYRMYCNCQALQECPSMDLSKATTISAIFNNDKSLHTVGEIDASSCENVSNAFYNCIALVNFGGLKDLGKGYIVLQNYYSNYALNLSYSTLLTHESLMNVINGLYDLNLTYDVANGGTLYKQDLKLSTESEALLSEEEKAIADKKGWVINRT